MKYKNIVHITRKGIDEKIPSENYWEPICLYHIWARNCLIWSRGYTFVCHKTKVGFTVVIKSSSFVLLVTRTITIQRKSIWLVLIMTEVDRSSFPQMILTFGFSQTFQTIDLVISSQTSFERPRSLVLLYPHRLHMFLGRNKKCQIRPTHRHWKNKWSTNYMSMWQSTEVAVDRLLDFLSSLII